MESIKKPIQFRVYPNPRMSANMLGEYISASASRRHAIIKDSRIVPTYIAKRYNLASAAIADFLSDEFATLECLKRKIIELKVADYTTKYEKEMSMSSIEALMAFANYAEGLQKSLLGHRIEMSAHFTYHKINLEGVEVSIRPEIIIRSSSNQIIGFIKLYFSKNNELDENRGDFITCLGRSYFSEAHSLLLSEKNCFVLDVFTGELSSAPKAFKRRMSDITASCREIADRWNRVN